MQVTEQEQIAEIIRGEKSWEVLNGNVLDVLRTLPDSSVHCCITSPPYWGLRTYGTDLQVWGGDLECEHVWADIKHQPKKDGGRDFMRPTGKWVGHAGTPYTVPSFFCEKCGAWHGELGGEPTIDLFIKNLVEIFHEVRRVLHPTGTCWINIGDSYAGSGKGPTGKNGIGDQGKRQGFIGGTESDPRRIDGLGGDEVKAKDLCLIPEELAIALRKDGWWIRSKIAWLKTNSMPESVKDRPSSSWEIIWMLTKEGRYYYDSEAVRLNDEQYQIRNFWEIDPPESDSWKITTQHFDGEYCFGCEKLYDGDLKKQISNRCTECGYTTRKRIQRVRDFDGKPRTPCSECGAPHVEWDRICPICNTAEYWVSHFAAFPERLAEICVRGGSSEQGVCAECLAPFRKDGLLIIQGCKCPNAQRIPAVVLDPFSGIGTTVMVARRLGRSGIGIELNPKYHRFSVARIREDQPLFN